MRNHLSTGRDHILSQAIDQHRTTLVAGRHSRQKRTIPERPEIAIEGHK